MPSHCECACDTYRYIVNGEIFSKSELEKIKTIAEYLKLQYKLEKILGKDVTYEIKLETNDKKAIEIIDEIKSKKRQKEEEEIERHKKQKIIDLQNQIQYLKEQLDNLK